MTELLHHVQQQGWSVAGYARPTRLDDALELLGRHGERARVVAGATDLLLELDRGARPDVDVLVDLQRIDGLADIERLPDGRVALGALVTHNDVVAYDRTDPGLRPLAQACWEVGSPQLRNRATVVGNLVTASPANDTISALLALGADITLASARGTRTLPIDEFITGFRTTALAPDELVTGVTVNALRPDQRGLFVKLGLRRAQAISVVHQTLVVTLADPDEPDVGVPITAARPSG
ncbi:MAG: FAD binding domain-containing protein, partial [Actinomycetota bacterium]